MFSCQLFSGTKGVKALTIPNLLTLVDKFKTLLYCSEGGIMRAVSELAGQHPHRPGSVSSPFKNRRSIYLFMLLQEERRRLSDSPVCL